MLWKTFFDKRIGLNGVKIIGRLRYDKKYFWANSAIFLNEILAYNLMVWMMWLNTETRFHEEPNTIRAWLIQVPAKLICRARQLILTLIYDYVFKERWLEIEDSISTLNFA